MSRKLPRPRYRAVDEALTAPVASRASGHARTWRTSGQGIGVPLLIMNAADDPISQYNMKGGLRRGDARRELIWSWP